MINWDAFKAATIAGAVNGLHTAAGVVAERAKAKAPVRRIFAIQELQVQTRLKSEDEISADVELRQRLGMRPENAYLYPPSIVSVRAEQYLTHRTIGAIDMAALSSRGNYEVNSQRAAHQGQIGGKLRDQITVGQVSVDGNILRVEILSPTPYAKQQELGNRHNPAHPYMRPALHESKDDFRDIVAKSVLASARTGLVPGRRTKVTIRLKARAGANGS